MSIYLPLSKSLRCVPFGPPHKQNRTLNLICSHTYKWPAPIYKKLIKWIDRLVMFGVGRS